VEASGKEGLFDKVELDFLSPFVWLEVALHLVSRDLRGEAGVGNLDTLVWLEENLRDSEVEFTVLDFVQSDIDFILKGTLEVKVPSFT